MRATGETGAAPATRNPMRQRLPASPVPSATRGAACVLLLALALPAVAQDRARSDDCRRALAALDAQEAQAASAADRSAALQRVRMSRREAARACLGGTGEPPPLSARPIEPLRPVPPPPPALIPPPPRPPAPTTQIVPPPAPAPVVTSCDPGGCWSSDGSRMLRVGPTTVVGPKGACTVTGAVVSCP